MLCLSYKLISTRASFFLAGIYNPFCFIFRNVRGILIFYRLPVPYSVTDLELKRISYLYINSTSGQCMLCYNDLFIISWKTSFLKINCYIFKRCIIKCSHPDIRLICVSAPFEYRVSQIFCDSNSLNMCIFFYKT